MNYHLHVIEMNLRKYYVRFLCNPKAAWHVAYTTQKEVPDYMLNGITYGFRIRKLNNTNEPVTQ